MNATANTTRRYTTTSSIRHGRRPSRPRVDGAFTGTTDEIIQWAACKWGIDEDIVRAQAAKESYWSRRRTATGVGYPADQCPPGTGSAPTASPGSARSRCGLGQTRYGAATPAFPNAEHSTAINVDVYLAIWRACYDGKDTWLNPVERGRQYGAGDVWGCIGKWFSGRWYTPARRRVHRRRPGQPEQPDLDRRRLHRLAG